MFEKIVVTSSCLMAATAISALAADFSRLDAMLGNPAGYSSVRSGLESILKASLDKNERAEADWRLSRVCMLMGEQENTKEGKQKLFGQGASYASDGIKENPSNHNCYMWHCANVGRECQTKKLMEQAKAVPVMMNDLSTILNKLGKVNCSEAWQALSEIYVNHPLKSTDCGINFCRKAATCIPSGELRLSTYVYFAGLLKSRGWSADKRKNWMADNANKFSGTDNIARYAYFDAGLGAKHTPKWSSKALGEMSDAEEAKALVEYAMKLYNSASSHTATDDNDYAELKKISK